MFCDGGPNTIKALDEHFKQTLPEEELISTTTTIMSAEYLRCDFSPTITQQEGLPYPDTELRERSHEDQTWIFLLVLLLLVLVLLFIGFLIFSVIISIRRAPQQQTIALDHI